MAAKVVGAGNLLVGFGKPPTGHSENKPAVGQIGDAHTIGWPETAALKLGPLGGDSAGCATHEVAASSLGAEQCLGSGECSGKGGRRGMDGGVG